MAACAQQVISILQPPQSQLRRLGETIAGSHTPGVHVSALTKVTKFKHDKVAAQTEAAVDQKIVAYLQKAAGHEEKKEAEYKALEKASEKKTEKVSFGTAGTPVMNTLNKLTRASELFDKTFLPVMSQSKKMSKTAAKAIDVISASNILTATAPASAYKFFKLQKMFRVCVTKLHLIIPLSSTFNKQYQTITTTVALEHKKLKDALKTDAARRLNIALQSPKFMEETKEYKLEAALGKTGIILARKIEEVAKNPGTGWLANSTSSSSRRLDESAFSTDFARPLKVKTSSLAATRHSSLLTLNQIMVFGVGLASGCFSFFVAVSGQSFLAKFRQVEIAAV
jgi:hypothetical protein